MTENGARQRYVNWANEQVGYPEGANNWNKYAENQELRKLLGWYAQWNPWCDLFTDVGLIECFGLEKASQMSYQPIGKGSALCRQSAQYFKDNGAWFDRPELGDIVFFYVSGGINHQGIVTAVGMGAITTVEGNSSDMVARRTYSIGSSSIAGYGRPNWKLAEDEGEDPEETPQTGSTAQEQGVSYCDYVYRVDTNLLKLGNHGPQVKNMQHLLNAHGFDCGEADGKFGEKTFAALTAFQTAAKIEVDGEWGGESFRTLWNLN